MIIIIFVFGIIILATLVQIKKQEKKRNKILIFLFLSVLLTIPFFIMKSDYELKANTKFTKGIITDFEYRRNGKYSLKYYFYVDGIKYIGTTSTYNFNCHNNKKCIGNEYTVAYSRSNPANNDINLEEFEKYKAGVRFLEVDWKLKEL